MKLNYTIFRSQLIRTFGWGQEIESIEMYEMSIYI